MRTYNFGTHWVTTDQVMEGAIESFEVTPEEVVLIEEGANIESVEGIIEITPEITFE